MKKLVIGLVILVVASFLALPMFLGVEVEDQCRQYMESFSVPGSMTAEIVEYERGWMSSTAQVVITFDAIEMAAAGDPEMAKLGKFVIQHEIKHGPLPMAGEFNGESASGFAAAVLDSTVFFLEEPVLFAQFFGEAPLLKWRAVVGFDGVVDGRMLAPELVFEAPDGSFKVDWRGFDGDFNMVGDRISGNVAGQGMEAGAGSDLFTLLPYKGDFDMVRDPSGFFFGEESSQLEGMRVDGEAGTTFALYDLDYVANSSVDEGLMKLDSTMTLASVKSEGREFGPGKMVMKMRNLSIGQISQLQSMMTGLESDPAATEEASAAALGELLAASPAMEISSLTFQTPDGMIEGNFKGEFDASKEYDLEDPDSMVRNLLARMSMTFPYGVALSMAESQATGAAFQQLMMSNPDAFPAMEDVEALAAQIAEQQVQAAIGQGLLVRQDDGRLLVDGGFEQGVLTVNGQVIE